MSTRKTDAVAVFWKTVTACWILLQLSEPAFSYGPSWDRRRAEVDRDNRIYPYSTVQHHFWSSWAEWQPCTRTCGGGISNRTRICQPRSRPDYCPGDSHQHRLCSNQACPKEDQDFRQRQCSAYNNSYKAGKHTRRWIPAQGHYGCDLKCRSVDHGFVYTFGKAENATRCHKSGEHICFNGRCLEVGCDLILGSPLRLDACGVCGGKNQSCQLVQGSYIVGSHYGRRKVTEKGYEEVAVIPAGSTRIFVSETSAQNYIALADRHRRILVNGGREVSWPGNYPVAGTHLNYSRQWQAETFYIPGPTKEDLYLMLLVYDKNGAPVQYKYWRPTATQPTKEIVRPPYSQPTRPGHSIKDVNKEFMEKYLGRKERELDENFQHLAEVLTKARELSAKVDKLGNFVVGLRIKRERMNNRPQPPAPGGSHPQPAQPEPREGPGRNPEDYKLYGDPYAHRDPRHHPQNTKPDRNADQSSSSANDPRYYPEQRPRDPSSQGSDKQKPGKTKKGRCPPCKRINEKVKNFCESDFVVRARVLDLETVGSETRYDLGIVESYKNTVFMSHREYVWSPAPPGATVPDCRCPRLRRNQDYVLMGRFDRNYRRRESRLVITEHSYVRKALPKRDLEMKNLKKVAARKCKRE